MLRMSLSYKKSRKIYIRETTAVMEKIIWRVLILSFEHTTELDTTLNRRALMSLTRENLGKILKKRFAYATFDLQFSQTARAFFWHIIWSLIQNQNLSMLMMNIWKYSTLNQIRIWFFIRPFIF